MASGSFHSRIHDPIVATYPILLHYNSSGWVMLSLILCVCVFFATSGYSVGYSPSVFLIILIASSMKVSHFHTLVAFLASDAISNDRACSGASVRLLIMFDQCSMSSSQVSLFCECPDCACEQASMNIRDSVARILIYDSIYVLPRGRYRVGRAERPRFF